MTAADYVVSFPYKAQDGKYYGPNGIVGLYHKGNDRYTPAWTPIEIQGQVIGYTGASGVVSGPHLHTQAWVGSPTQGDRDPTPYEFKPGVVVGTGSGGQWGTYITVDVGGVNVTYAHLAKVSVDNGDVIGEEMIQDTDNEYARWAQTSQFVRGRYDRVKNVITPLTRDEFRKAAVGKTWLRALEGLVDNAEAQTNFATLLRGKLSEADKWDQQIYALQDRIKQLESNNDVTPTEIEELGKLADALGQAIRNANK